MNNLENTVAELILQKLKSRDPIVEEMVDLCGEKIGLDFVKGIGDIDINMKKPYRAVAYLPYLGLRFVVYDFSQPNGIITVRNIYRFDKIKSRLNPRKTIVDTGIEGDFGWYIIGLN